MAQPATRASSGFVSWLRNHKAAGIIIVLGVLLLGWVAITNVSAYLHKFSKQDYDRLTTMAQGVLKATSPTNVETNRSCQYVRPQEWGALQLICRVELVTYLTYVGEDHAAQVASYFRANIQKQFKVSSNAFSTFYVRPYNGFGVVVATMGNQLPQNTQCNFYIATNRNAKNVLTFPEKSEDDLIALSFECAAEAREAYFPVTYRQG